MKPKIIFVTGNKHKIEEVQKALPEFEIIGNKIDLPELQGDPEMIVREKVKEACKQLNCSVMVDDSAVYINAFNGFPGPYAADYAKTVGNEKTLKMIEGFEDRSAAMVSRAAYCEPGKEPIVFE